MKDSHFGHAALVALLIGGCGNRGQGGAAREQVDKVAEALVAVQESKLTSADGLPGDYFGSSVSVAGDTAVIGASGRYYDFGGGYVFVRSNGSWKQQARLLGSDSTDQDLLGYSAATTGSTAILGAPDQGTQGHGAVYIFRGYGTSWHQELKLTANDGTGLDRFGNGVAVSGNTLLVGAPASNAGAGYVYVFGANGWVKQAKLTANDGAANDFLGWSASLSGDTAVLGATAKNSATGAAYVFVRSGSTWSQQAKLTASDGSAGDLFGVTVAVDGDTIVVGTERKNSWTGAVYVFQRNGTTWTQQAKLVGSDSGQNDSFGLSVALSGDNLFVGGGMSTKTGAVYAFRRTGSAWYQYDKISPSDAGSGDYFGGHVSISGNTVLASASGMSSKRGAVYTYLLKQDIGVACEFGTDCATGFCVDGTCCNEQCGAGSASDCRACSIAMGAAVEGICGPVANGSSCNDSNACTQTDSCQAGVCMGANAVSCPSLGPCHDPGVCNPSSGECSESTPRPEGASCTDGDLCTQNDTCKAGQCTAGGPVVCTASDQCHELGTCDPITGCSNPAKPDGTGCDDGDACTQTDTCQTGQCTGANPLGCTASDECHDPGICDPSSGTCSNPAKTDGAVCTGGTCESGFCVATPDAGPDGEAGSGGQAGAAGSGGEAGAGGSAGSPGTGGAVGTGGAAASPGSGGAAGAAGKGGAHEGGSSGSAEAGDGATNATDESGGCGCMNAGRATGSGAWVIALAALLRRRRRQRTTAR